MAILSPSLSQKFIDKTATYFEYNINIMNEKGIIIASKDTERIGDFHEVAYNMLNGILDSGVVKEEEKYLGTKLGVNLFIDYKGKHVGVIGISGAPESVQVFAEMLKTFIEAMLEYEVHMEGERRKRDKSEQFLYYLLFAENVDVTELHSMADDLGINKDILRVCIIVKNDSELSPKKIIQTITDSKGYSHQDIITVARNNDIILYKTINMKKKEAIKNYKYFMEEFINEILTQGSIKTFEKKISFYIGSLQEDIGKYRGSYIHAQHMTMKIKNKSGTYYFNDYIGDYYRDIVTLKVYNDIYSVYDTVFTKEEKKQITETVETLKKNNYNIVNSSKDLFVHRNTLLFRINKLKDILNIDPIANAADREFLNELAYYFGSK
ncbi:carbohydrate diacid regulator [Natranaerovirga pectinivora]|uniref:Carbohydrate diacid regulator n=1 Tax=Natranaerovirga pectinivora TaxID=682400 RepID=A0A4V2UZQ8_9FIRM|nr:sugar diacid recognition domain-containing protein [Natranaerovirga pectinivora]TCT12222.1 carbohydrate diacid regulator [Natranaerovirga pectinivora]